jgi:hypothetical protein
VVCAAPHPPRPPCASPRFAKPRARQGAVHLHCPPIALRACLCCDFALRSESNGCSGALPPRCAGSPSGRLAERVCNFVQIPFFHEAVLRCHLSLCEVTQAGPRDHGEARAGRRAHKQPLASRRTEKSQHRHARRAIGGQCKCTDPCRARGLSKRIDAQGGSRGLTPQDVAPDMYSCCFFSFSSKTLFFFP